MSHSVIIIAQIISSLIKIKKNNYSKSKKIITANKKDIQSMINLCIHNLENIKFFKPLEKKPLMIENLRSIFFKMELSKKETRILSSIFAIIDKKK